MAGAEKLIEKILSDAQRDADQTLRESEEKKQAMREKQQRDIEKRKAQIARKSDESVLENKKRLAAVYDLEYRKQLLSAKQDMMQEAKTLAMQKLAALSDADYLSLLKRRLVECAAGGQGSIIVSQDDTRLDNAFVADVNKALQEKYGTGAVTLSDKRRDIRGGFIYVNGGLEIDVSLDALLDQAWQQCETDVAALLFDND